MIKNLQEIIGGKEIETLLNERDCNIYWGTATTGMCVKEDERRMRYWIKSAFKVNLDIKFG